MNDSRSAISCSRRSGGPSPSATASSLINPIGRSAAITFQVASEAASSRFSHASCAGAEDESRRPWSSRLFQVESAIAAHVDQEHIEQRPIADLAIDPALPGPASARIGMNS